MRRALELAERGRYSVSPNPMVGAVLVRDGVVLGEGFHLRAGEPHAEIEALRNATESPRGATLYVTLEPCCHQGRTPPCTNAILEAGIGRVVTAAEDPSGHAGGRGLQILREAGLELAGGILEAEARRQNEVFFHAATHDTPFVVVKAGMSLDGKLATRSRQSQWITSPQARERSLNLREIHDAILVGAGTVLADDPRLTRRLSINTSVQPWIRAVVDAEGRIPPGARVLADGRPTLIYTGSPERYHSLGSSEAVELPVTEGTIELEPVLRDLRRRGVQSLIVEGGSRLITSVIREKLWQKMILFIAPTFIGGAEAPSIFGDFVDTLDRAPRFRFDTVEKIGPDLVVTAYPA